MAGCYAEPRVGENVGSKQIERDKLGKSSIAGHKRSHVRVQVKSAGLVYIVNEVDCMEMEQERR